MAPEQNSKAKKFKDDFWKSKDIKISIGEIAEEGGGMEAPEVEGPTPKPNITDLRSWDMKLLRKPWWI